MNSIINSDVGQIADATGDMAEQRYLAIFRDAPEFLQIAQFLDYGAPARLVGAVPDGHVAGFAQWVRRIFHHIDASRQDPVLIDLPDAAVARLDLRVILVKTYKGAYPIRIRHVITGLGEDDFATGLPDSPIDVRDQAPVEAVRQIDDLPVRSKTYAVLDNGGRIIF